MTLGGQLYLDLSGDVDMEDFGSVVDELVLRIRRLTEPEPIEPEPIEPGPEPELELERNQEDDRRCLTFKEMMGGFEQVKVEHDVEEMGADAAVGAAEVDLASEGAGTRPCQASTPMFDNWAFFSGGAAVAEPTVLRCAK
jgi:hypothetical protein